MSGLKGTLQALPLVGEWFQDVTPDEVRRFWRYMCNEVGASVIDKSKAGEMKLVADMLGALGIQDRDAFMNQYTTTLGTRIYVPFEVGSPEGGWDLWQQMIICVHELQHVLQYRKGGPINFGLAYLTDRAARTEFEVEAYTCNLEMNYWRYGKTGSAKAQARSLRGYAVRESDIYVAEQGLGLAAYSITQGAVATEAMSIALPWLNEVVGRLRKGR